LLHSPTVSVSHHPGFPLLVGKVLDGDVRHCVVPSI
jgi:hypothetical protein